MKAEPQSEKHITLFPAPVAEQQPDPPPAAPAAAVPPTPEEIDQAIAAYNHAKQLSDSAKATLDTEKDKLVFLVTQFGQVPPHAEQSRRLVGRHNEAVVTRANSVAVDETAIGNFFSFLIAEGMADLFTRFFATQTRHTLVEGAHEVLKGLSLPRRSSEKIASLFGRCIQINPKAPAVRVALIQPEKPARKPRAGKKAA